MTDACAVCGTRINKRPKVGKPRVLCHKTKCRSIYAHNYMIAWWKSVKQGKTKRHRVKEVNLDRYDFSGNMGAGIYFL